MDIVDILKLGARLIQGSKNESTSNLDINSIVNALSSVFGSSNSENSLDLNSIASKVTDGNLSKIITSWIGSGENIPIDKEKVEELLGRDKIDEFAKKLGIDHETAKDELANVLPQIIDKATNEDKSLAENLMKQIGGSNDLTNMVSKFFRS